MENISKLFTIKCQEILFFKISPQVCTTMGKPSVIVSRDRVEMAERVAITASSFILENPKCTIAVTVGVCVFFILGLKCAYYSY